MLKRVDCPVCGENHPTRAQFSINTHAKKVHGLEPIELYKLYFKIDKFICLQCGNEHQNYVSFNKGHRRFCNLSCSQKYVRANRSPEAEESFRAKLSVSVANGWAEHDQTDCIQNIMRAQFRGVEPAYAEGGEPWTDEENNTKFLQLIGVL